MVPDGFNLLLVEPSSEAGREFLCEDQPNNIGSVCQKSNLSARDHASCLHFSEKLLLDCKEFTSLFTSFAPFVNCPGFYFGVSVPGMVEPDFIFTLDDRCP